MQRRSGSSRTMLEGDNGTPEHLVLCLLQKHSSWLPSLAALLLDAMGYTMP